MRPIKLVLQAFGPFAQRQEVDFRVLGDKSFFLIHGPTGAGKTSLLDAMCIALFGDSSGKERKDRQMRSDHADSATSTEVVFEFALGARHYRVRRSPEQPRITRKARAADTKSMQPASADLWEVTIADGLEQLQPLISGDTKVTQRVVSLLGFTSEQFRQLIVLPQGKFFQFLKSTSAEREAILQTLFGTERFEAVEAELARAVSANEQDARDLRTRRQTLLEHSGSPTPAALDELVVKLRVDAQIQEAATQAAAAEVARQDAALIQARAIEDRFVELGSALAQHQELVDCKPQHDLDVERLERAKRAMSLAPALDDLRRTQRQLHDEQICLNRCKHDVEVAGRHHDEAVRALDSAASRIGRGEQLGLRIAFLGEMQHKVQALTAARRDHESACSQVADAQRSCDEASRWLDSARQLEEQLEQQVQEMALAAARIEGLKLEQEVLRGQCQAAASVERLVVEIRRYEAVLQTCSQAVSQSQSDRTRLQDQRDRAQRAWVEGQAVRLARELVAHCPCPVCGSVDHPSPAHGLGHGVDDDGLSAAQSALEAAHDKLTEALAHQAKTQAALDALKLSLLDQQARVSREGVTPAELQRMLESCDAELRRCEQAGADLQTRQGRLAVGKQARASAQQALDNARQTLAHALAAAQTLAGQLAEREAGVPAALGDAQKLATELQSAVSERAAIFEARDTAQAQMSAAQARLATTRELAAQCSSRLDALTESMLLKQEDLASMRRSAGFEDQASLDAATLSHEVLAELEARTRHHQASLMASHMRLERARSLTQDITRPDVGMLESALVAARLDLEDKRRTLYKTQGDAEAAEAHASNLRSLSERYDRAEKAYGLSKRVHDACSGNNPKRISLQRYVLATDLESVLAAATIRLRSMSSNRFEIHRKTEAGDKRAGGGLDLEVFDHHTSTSRAVTNFSGGESFMASLALALGLSDVVQGYAGGVRMDAIFVDEGFGTLDSEALDRAIRTLKDLQKAGRMVGIISHVSELKDCIDARLELKVGQKGSHAQFVV